MAASVRSVSTLSLPTVGSWAAQAIVSSRVALPELFSPTRNVMSLVKASRPSVRITGTLYGKRSGAVSSRTMAISRR